MRSEIDDAIADNTCVSRRSDILIRAMRGSRMVTGYSRIRVNHNT
jgi:hypothetical protein